MRKELLKKAIMPLLLSLATAASMLAITGCEVIYDAPIENVTIVSNAIRYTRDEPVKQMGVGTLSAQLAQNEYEGMQFILNFEQDIRNATIEVSELKNNDGQTLSVTGIYREHYIKKAEADSVYYADALVPLCYDASRYFDIAAGQNQGIWINIKSAKGQAPGFYRGTATVTSDSGKIEIPIEAEVWNFEIPTTPSNETSFELWFQTVWTLMQHNNATEGVDYYKIMQDYYWFSADYRLISASIPEPYTTAEQFADLAEKYLADERINLFRLPNQNRNFIDELDSRGLLDKCFLYTYDEPAGSAYNTIIDDFTALHEYNPDVRALLTSSPRAPLYDAVDIWCAIWSTDNHHEEFVRDMQARGDEVWWYGCITPGNPYPSYMLQNNTMAMRLVQWMQRDWNITGNLYWGTAISTHWDGNAGGWNNVSDIWTDPITIYGAGDGRLIYAGTKNDGVVNENVPIPTIRLEQIRAGQEDYEYLCLMQQKAQNIIEKYNISDMTADEYMDTYYGALYNSMGDYDKNPNELLEQRCRLAHDIMASDDALVAVITGAKGEEMTRELKVYAPSEASVTADGELLEKTEREGYAVYTKTYVVSEKTTVTISIDGEEYERTLMPVPEADIRTLSYKCQTDDATQLEIPLTLMQVHTNVEKNRFVWLNTDGDETKIESITNDKELLPLFTKSIASHTANSFPLVLVSEEDNIKPTQMLSLYVEKGATVSVDGQDAVLAESGEKYSLYTLEKEFETTGRHEIDIAVTKGGQTQHFCEIVFQSSVNKAILIDFSDEATQQALAKDACTTITKTADGADAIALNIPYEKPRGVYIPSELFANGITNSKGYTNIVFDITNNTDHCITLPTIQLIADMAFDVTPLFGMLGAHDTVTVTAKLPKDAEYAIDGLRFKQSDPSTSGEFLISGIRFANMPEYVVTDTDAIQLYK